MDLKIGICIPTRGMVFAQVIEALERERSGFKTNLYTSFDQVIPTGHNMLAKKALEDGCSHILFIEEDTVMPAGSLVALLGADAAIACIDYGVSGWGCVARSGKGEVLWCGLGCTLIKRQVFEEAEYPFFRSDKQLRLNDWTWIDAPINGAYGGLDIWFCCKAREKGFKIVQLDGECDHLKLDELGKIQTNNGLHQISLKERISKHQIIQI